MSFSLEAIRACFPHHPDFLEINGSVGTSPAATASLLLRAEGVSQKALDYLRSTVLDDGGIPNVSPIDTFEAAWSLNYLRQAGVVSPDEPKVRQVLEKLWAAWSPKNGLGFSSYYSVSDLDDTAVAYAVLRWGGYAVETDIFAQFEEEDHFRCFPHEIDPSISATLRLVDALQMDPTYPKYEAWMQKAVGMLRRVHNSGLMWFDKWHASPFYPVCISIHALRHIAEEIVTSQLNWLLSSQHTDGGWGYYGYSTPEETAYALLALFYWDELREAAEPDRIHAAAAFLMARFGNAHLTPLWLGKCLYTPSYVVRSLIVAALHQYYLWCESQ
jgi:halimadienyl-diphosphate synthase